ncbi:MAG: ABC transporter ATP-binding protein [Lachnospiraceae bacterium]|nr:ABC transporter ATP-binding protein [Lachnospiraceae bacterium]
MSEEKLIAKNLVKTYGKKEVLHGIDLELEKGKIYGLIGRNGAGKTTLLSILSAQNLATKGSITCNGLPVWENRKALDHICFSRELNPVTGYGQNTYKVKDYLKAASIYMPNWDKELAERLLKEFELDKKKRISRLSKGMMSMVTIIIALASKADYTFLDEPVAGLDVVMREYFYQVLLDEFTNSGRTFVISTHIIEEASDIFEEVVMLDKGKIILKENTQELLERSYHISGKIEAVDEFTKGLKTFHEEKMGRSKGVMVLVEPGKELIGSADVTVQPINLQQIFVAMCGREAVQS